MNTSRLFGCLVLATFLLPIVGSAQQQKRELTPQQQRARKHREELKALGIRVKKPQLPQADAIESQMDVVYATYGDRKLHLDLFMPRERSEKTAAVVVVHGGGWHKGDRKSFHNLTKYLAMNGFVAVAIEYRLADEANFPAAIHDCNAATRWLRANSKRLRIDTDRIAAVGGSAGGHLVGLMGAASDKKELQGEGGNGKQSSKLNAVAVFAGPLQMTTGSVAERSRKEPGSNANRWLGKTIDEAPELYALSAPYKQLSEKTPQMLFLTGELDKPERNQPTRLKLREFGIKSDVVAYRYGRHACWNQDPWFFPMANDVIDFLISAMGEAGGTTTPIPVGNALALDNRIEVPVGDMEKKAKVKIPRLNNPIGKVYFKDSKQEVKLIPGTTTWDMAVTPRASGKTIVVETLGRPHLPTIPRIVTAEPNGNITLAAHDAITHGELLRYEPQPHKNTVGYWANPEDWVEWHFYTETPGTFDLHVLQGCGKSHGGSEVEVLLGKQIVNFIVEDTGHFQNFKDRTVGKFKIHKPGVYTLRINAKKKAKIAIMDVRQVRLVRTSK